MAQIGSFALLLALALSAYSFLAGLLALLRPGAVSERLGETARRAGIAAFAVVLLAAVVLVIAAFQDDFSIGYIFHHSNRDLSAPSLSRGCVGFPFPFVFARGALIMRYPGEK